jgi:hypothetical protein
MTFARIMSLIAMALLWTGSQIPVYLYGGVSILRHKCDIAHILNNTTSALRIYTATLAAQIDGLGSSLPTCCL